MDLRQALSGTIAGRYTIERELGYGATSLVYLARDLASERRVALKVLRLEFAESIGAERFLKEIQVVKTLEHPGIVGLLDSGVHEGRPFYVLPYMEGGTLRERLQAERQLPVTDVIEIGTRVAEALEFAHTRNLIHRDVKPENILFHEGKACLADFGIARAIERLTGDMSTSTGVIRGTPAYMSPEQAAGQTDIDGRSDIYSLACVLYEALAGVPAFVGPTSQSILQQRILHAPRGVRVYRPVVPIGVEDALAKALATGAADRWKTAEEFAQSLRAGSTSESDGLRLGALQLAGRRRARRLVAFTAVLLAAIVAASLALKTGALGVNGLGAPPLDSLLYTIVPIQVGDTADARRAVDAYVASLGAFTDVRISRIDSGIAGRGEVDFSRAVEMARVGRSRWLVVVDPASFRVGQVRASVIDVRSGGLIAQGAHVISDPTKGGARLTTLPGELLGMSALGSLSTHPTHSARVRIWRLYDRAIGQIHRFQLDSADAILSEIRAQDPDFALAAIRLAQLRNWRKHALSSDIITLLRQVQNRLPTDDSLLTVAVLAMSDSLFPKACGAFEAMRRRDSLNVEAWIGLGDCHTRDRTIVSDSRSPSRWRFRTSYEAGMRAYVRAAEINPAAATILAPGATSGPLLLTPSRLLLGTVRGDSTLYAAYPSVDLKADTIRLVPFEFALQKASASRAVFLVEPRSIDRAVENHRRLWLRMTWAWHRAAPGDPDASEALGRALETGGDLGTGTGDSSAFGVISQARVHSANESQKFRLSVALVRLAVKQGDFAEAHRLADSLLRDADAHPTVAAARASSLAAMAALIGRLDATRRWSEAAADVSTREDADVPAPVRRALAGLVAAAALGRCDSIPALLNRTETGIRSYVPPTRVEAVWNATIPRALSLAVPCDPGRSLSRVKIPSDRLIMMQQAFAAGETAKVRAQFDTLAVMRRNYRPGEVSLDYTFLESWLLWKIGDSHAALERITSTLASLPTVGPESLGQVPQAAALCRIFDLAITLSPADEGKASGWARDKERLCAE